jgi:peroxiredoxin/uncharacterized membrane protein YphA (DoxX/SURF4 family)
VILLLFANVVMALIFLFAGVSKLRDISRFRQTIIEFGIRPAAAGPISFVLPVTEVIIFVAFLFGRSAGLAAVVAAILMTVFSAAITLNLISGRSPSCNCFGQWSVSPITWVTMMRTAVLAMGAIGLAVADIRVIDGDAYWRPLKELGWAPMVIAVGAILFLVTFLVLFQLVRQSGRLILRVEALELELANQGRPTAALAEAAQGLALGTSAPPFALPNLRQELTELTSLLSHGKPLLLIFSDPDCGPCTALMSSIAQWQRDLAAAITITVVSRGSAQANRAKAELQGVNRILLQADREVAEAYLCSGTPGAVLVGRNGLIASPLAMGAEAISSLVDRVTGKHRHLEVIDSSGDPHGIGPVLAVGSPVPDMGLRDTRGTAISFESTERTILIFWNPACGFCRDMLQDLTGWETSGRSDASRMILFSAGSVEEIQAMGLRSPVVADPNFRMGQMFGATGTPTAVLLDPRGCVASDVAVGRNEIMLLLRNGASGASGEQQRLAIRS